MHPIILLEDYPMSMVEMNDLLPASQWEDNWTFFGEQHQGLPEGVTYVVFEYYCDNLKCDCESLRAEITQLGIDGEPIKKPLVLIDYDWSSKKKPCHPVLSEDSPKTHLAFSLLDVYKKFIHHPEYIKRIKNHYARVKRLVYERQIQRQLLHEMEKFQKKQMIRRNDPCVCGSGKKYKKCCFNQ